MLERVTEIGFAEIGEITVGAATEGSPVAQGRRDDERIVVLEDVEKAAGIAGRHDDHAVTDPGMPQHCFQRGGRKVVHAQRAELYRQPMIAVAVRA